MPSYDSILEEIKSRVDIVDLISEHVSLKKTGQNWKGLCPFHPEKTPSFIVSPAKQIYHCFGCGSGGDIFTFLVRQENISFKDAVRELAKKAGVLLRTYHDNTAERGEKESLLNLNKNALGFFQEALWKNPKAMNYLEKRSIDKKGQRLFSVGYAPKTWNSLLSYLEGKGCKVELIKKAGLVAKGEKGYYDVFRDRIIFPIFDLKEHVIAFGGRALDNSEPKYLNSPETPVFNKRRVLYGFNLARESIKKSGYVLLMEGYLDVITAHLHGFLNSVAPLGTAVTQEQGRLIKRFTEEAILVFDSDQAGVKAAKNAAGILMESGVNVRLLALPEDDDPDSFLRKKGGKAFDNLLKSPLSIVDFLIQQRQDKRIITREAVEMISKISDRVLQGSYVKVLSEKLGINEFFIIEELKGMRKKSRQAVGTDAPASSRLRPADEVYILKLLLQIPEKAEWICNLLSVEDFNDPATRSLFSKVKQGMTDYNKLMLQCEGEGRDLLTEILLKADFDNPEKALEDCLKRFRVKKRRTILQEIQARIKDAELKGDRELLRNLQMEQYRLLKSGGI